MALPAHLFVSSPNGALYDTRQEGWSKAPALRADYQAGHSTISTVANLKAALRNGEYAWPGGYQMYFITNDGGALSFDAVREQLRNVIDSIQERSNDGWRVVACDINYEDQDLVCDHTGERIPSAYGENDSE